MCCNLKLRVLSLLAYYASLSVGRGLLTYFNHWLKKLFQTSRPSVKCNGGVEASPAEDFGQKLRRARIKQHFSMQIAAERSGISASSMEDFECGRRRPTPSEVLQLCEAMGISVSDLLNL